MKVRLASKRRLVVLAGTLLAASAATIALAGQVGSDEAPGVNPVLVRPSASSADAAYVAVASAPRAAWAAENPLVATMAERSGIQASDLTEVVAATDQRGALVAGRDAAGKTCVGLASESSAGSFVCDPLSQTPAFVIATSAGSGGELRSSGLVGIASAVVRRLVVRTTGGESIEVPVNSARGFAYDAERAQDYAVTLEAYDASGELVLDQFLPEPDPTMVGLSG